MKLVNQDLELARQTLCKANEENVDEVEKRQVEAVLKQSKYALLKPEENLTEKQKTKLEEIREVISVLAQMHQKKEAFRTLFEQTEDWADGPLNQEIGKLAIKSCA